MKIPLADWAALHYRPAPSLYTLRKMARNGEIYPAPEKIGRDYYVDSRAVRVAPGAPTPELPPEPAPEPPPEPPPSEWAKYVFTPQHMAENAREFYDPRQGGSGVYVVLEKDLKSALYVGSSKNLSHRLRNGWHMPCDAPTFAFNVPELDRHIVEASYYEALRPRANQMSPPVGADDDLTKSIRRAWGLPAC